MKRIFHWVAIAQPGCGIVDPTGRFDSALIISIEAVAAPSWRFARCCELEIVSYYSKAELAREHADRLLPALFSPLRLLIITAPARAK